jgi:hypothetical protein
LGLPESAQKSAGDTQPNIPAQRFQVQAEKRDKVISCYSNGNALIAMTICLNNDYCEEYDVA